MITHGTSYQSSPYQYNINPGYNTFNHSQIEIDRNQKLLQESLHQDPNHIVVNRYSQSITNIELGSLQEGRRPSAKIINFVYCYIQDLTNSGAEGYNNFMNRSEDANFPKHDGVNIEHQNHFRNRILLLN